MLRSTRVRIRRKEVKQHGKNKSIILARLRIAQAKNKAGASSQIHKGSKSSERQIQKGIHRT